MGLCHMSESSLISLMSAVDKHVEGIIVACANMQLIGSTEHTTPSYVMRLIWW